MWSGPSPNRSRPTVARARYAARVGSTYLLSRKRGLTSRFVITDGMGVPQFEVEGRFAFARKLSIQDPAGMEVAVISRRGLGKGYQILIAGREATVTPRGFGGRRFEISTPGGPLEASGKVSGRHYSVGRGGIPAVAVTQSRGLRQQFTVDVADGEDALLMLAVVLVIETVKAEHRQASG
jgi:uncharacterized protein YxjI